MDGRMNCRSMPIHSDRIEKLPRMDNADVSWLKRQLTRSAQDRLVLVRKKLERDVLVVVLGLLGHRVPIVLSGLVHLELLVIQVHDVARIEPEALGH